MNELINEARSRRAVALKTVELGTLSQHGGGVNSPDQIILYLFGNQGLGVGR